MPRVGKRWLIGSDRFTACWWFWFRSKKILWLTESKSSCYNKMCLSSKGETVNMLFKRRGLEVAANISHCGSLYNFISCALPFNGEKRSLLQRNTFKSKRENKSARRFTDSSRQHIFSRNWGHRFRWDKGVAQLAFSSSSPDGCLSGSQVRGRVFLGLANGLFHVAQFSTISCRGKSIAMHAIKPGHRLEGAGISPYRHYCGGVFFLLFFTLRRLLLFPPPTSYQTLFARSPAASPSWQRAYRIPQAFGWNPSLSCLDLWHDDVRLINAGTLRNTWNILSCEWMWDWDGSIWNLSFSASWNQLPTEVNLTQNIPGYWYRIFVKKDIFDICSCHFKRYFQNFNKAQLRSPGVSSKWCKAQMP